MNSAWPAPCVGEILWCQFPEIPDMRPGPKPRPALILAVEKREDGCNITVAYGTSRNIASLRTGEFAICRDRNPAAFELAGLAFDTKFDCKVVVTLPWSEAYFKIPARAIHGQTPKLGTLHPSVYGAARAAFVAASSR